MPGQGKIVFEMTEVVEGGYDDGALDYSIFTQGEDPEDLKFMVKTRFVVISATMG